MKKNLIKAKLKASGIHLAISAIIFIGILYLILVEWYPGPFFTAEGGWNGVKLMAAVDLVLGPSLTFIIFNNAKAKKEIILDLTLIAIVQISALIWGGLQVFSERPVALVFWEDTFYTVTEDYYGKQNVELAEIEKLSKYKPLLIYAETDHSVEQLEKIQALNSKKIPPYAQVHLYKELSSNLASVLSNSIDLSLLKDDVRLDNMSERDVVDVNAIIGKAKYKNLIVYITDTGDLLAIKTR